MVKCAIEKVKAVLKIVYDFAEIAAGATSWQI